MKKEYIAPTIKAIKINTEQMLAGSDSLKYGGTQSNPYANEEEEVL